MHTRTKKTIDNRITVLHAQIRKIGEGIWTVQKEMEPVITTQQHFKLSKIQRREQKKQWKYIEETYSTSKNKSGHR